MAECYKTIEYPDRKAIAALYAAGAKAGQIAKEIGVAPRTIYAELKRGREGDKLDKNFRPSYDADLAQKRAQESLRRRGRRKGGPADGPPEQGNGERAGESATRPVFFPWWPSWRFWEASEPSNRTWSPFSLARSECSASF